MGWTRQRARLAALHRYRSPDDPAVVDATRDLAAERLAEHVRRVVDAAPPLTPEQIERLRGLLPYPYPRATPHDREVEPA